jgi:hypothetical protein
MTMQMRFWRRWALQSDQQANQPCHQEYLECIRCAFGIKQLMKFSVVLFCSCFVWNVEQECIQLCFGQKLRNQNEI